jgi:GNAT superfamily N-acetyltransferase
VPNIAPAVTADDIAAVRALMIEYTAWVIPLTAGLEVPPTFEGLDEELANLPGPYAPPGGQLFLARHAGQPAGYIALKPAGPATGELKRLYVQPTFRGLNIGGQLVAAVVQTARQAGYQRLVLDSHLSMAHAHALYRAAGFRDVEAPPDFPAELRPVVVFMEMALTA